MKRFYITTTLPYVNADPHVGFALEIVQADTIARYHRLLGDGVIFNFGTDEHGLKIYRAAAAVGKDPQKYCDEYAAKFNGLKKALNLSYTNFIRTTDKHHIEAAKEFWMRCDRNGDIYKKNYRAKYCVGCELEKTDSELEHGRCPIHPNLDLEIFEEENYFFRFSRYQDGLLKLYANNPTFVVPQSKFSEIKKFVTSGLEDFSISRWKKKMPWGVDVPGDPEHVMFVWFDALINYISTLGWPENTTAFAKWWPGVQVAGKDNLRQQTAIWQAMLMSAGLPNSKQIFIHGFITSNGQKMSKSLGNVVNPFELVSKYGTDPVRYYLLREIPSWSDGDFSDHRFKEVYNADLANGLGNTVSRVAKLCETSGLLFSQLGKLHISQPVKERIEEFRLHDALGVIWSAVEPGIGLIDKSLNDDAPWKRKGELLKQSLEKQISRIRQVAYDLQPFLPQTSEKILEQFKGPTIKSQPPLFPRI